MGRHDCAAVAEQATRRNVGLGSQVGHPDRLTSAALVVCGCGLACAAL